MIDIGNAYIYAKEIYEIKGKPAYAIVNKKSGAEIACVAWYPAWNRYVMFTDAPAVFDMGCMESVIKFIQGLGRCGYVTERVVVKKPAPPTASTEGGR